MSFPETVLRNAAEIFQGQSWLRGGVERSLPFGGYRDCVPPQGAKPVAARRSMRLPLVSSSWV